MTRLIINLHRKIFARQIFRNINLALFHMSLRGLGILNWENFEVSGEKHLIRKILPAVIETANPVFLDVGANIGNYSALLLDCFPQALIYAFEPHPKNYSYLKDRNPSNRVKTYNIALGQTRGRFMLYEGGGIHGSEHASLHKAVISEIYKQEIAAYEVAVETLDNFAEEQGIRNIDFIKIDTEGNDLAVLRGASRLLGDRHIKCIQFEFNSMNVVTRAFYRDFSGILHNYELYRLLPSGLLHLDDSPLETELFGYQNIFALLK